MTERDQQRALVLTRWIGAELASQEAVLLLGLSERQGWRLKRRFLTEGPAALVHGNRGRASPRRIDNAVRMQIVELARSRYDGANDCHLAELLAEREGIDVGRATLRRILRSAGRASPRRRRPPRHRSRRDRMPQEGLLLQLDGSRHDWPAGRGPWLTLLSTIDDATGRLVAATFRDEEDTAGYLELLRDTVRDNGIPGGIYRDGHGAFEPTHPRAGQSVEERRATTHVGAALASLGIRSIAAGSPQAKGRIERSFGTDQGRLVVLLRLAGATDREGANRVLAAYLVARNARFTVPAADPTPAWRPVPRGIDLDEIFSFRFRRKVANDHTVRIGGLVLDLPPLKGRRGYAGRTVDVQVRLDGRIVVRDRDETLLRTAPILDTDRLRSLATAPAKPRTGSPVPIATDRPGYPPGGGHPWRRVDPRSRLGQTLQEQRLTESPTR